MSKYDLIYEPPIMNAAGSLGFAPDVHSTLDLDQIGVFVTNPISYERRSPARTPRTADFTGGFLLHTGFPNPGFRSVIHRYASSWKQSPVPVVVHLLYQDPGDTLGMIAELEDIPGVSGVELGIPPDASIDMLNTIIENTPGELPVILRLPFEQALFFATRLCSEFISTIAAVSLAPARGAIALDDKTVIRGRLYGPAVFPQALAIVYAIAQTGVPVIGAGGLYHPENIQAMLDAGAIGVQLDSVLWRGVWPPP